MERSTLHARSAPTRRLDSRWKRQIHAATQHPPQTCRGTALRALRAYTSSNTNNTSEPFSAAYAVAAFAVSAATAYTATAFFPPFVAVA